MKTDRWILAAHILALPVIVICYLAFHLQWSWWWMVVIWMVLPFWIVPYAFILAVFRGRKLARLKALRAQAAYRGQCTSEFEAWMQAWDAKHSM